MNILDFHSKKNKWPLIFHNEGKGQCLMPQREDHCVKKTLCLALHG